MRDFTNSITFLIQDKMAPSAFNFISVHYAKRRLAIIKIPLMFMRGSICHCPTSGLWCHISVDFAGILIFLTMFRTAIKHLKVISHVSSHLSLLPRKGVPTERYSPMFRL